MRAQVRKSTPHSPVDASSPSSGTPATVPAGEAAQTPPQAAVFKPRGRRTRVRSRLLLGVVLGSAAVLAAGAPAVLAAGERLAETQQLVQDSELAQRAVSLSHILADERDVLMSAAAAGVTPGDVLSEADVARADRRAADLRSQLPDAVGTSLDGLAVARADALAGRSDAPAVHAAYTPIIEDLDGVTRTVSRARPDRGAVPASDALPDLVRAVEASAATRALLVAALAGEGEQRELVGLAQRSHAREGAALADFTATAGEAGRAGYESTVTGPGVAAAEERLAELTAQPFLTFEARTVSPAELSAELSARTELQRGLLSSVAADQTRSLHDLRADDLTALQVHAALVGGALLVALAAGIWTARTVTHPLAVLRRGSRRVADAPSAEAAISYSGRDDEFADVVAAVNKLHARAVELHRYQANETADYEALRAELDELRGEQRELIERLSAQTKVMHANLTHHARLALDLAGEQLDIIGGLEEHETDPDSLATLFALDHLAARMRRHSENLLLLAGVEPDEPLPRPIPLVQVALAAVSESARYELVDVEQPVPAVLVTPVAARDLGHLLAELLDNATGFSPEGARVLLSSEIRAELPVTRAVVPEPRDRLSPAAGTGGAAAAAPAASAAPDARPEHRVVLRVLDDGPGLTDSQLRDLNAQLADASGPPPGARGEPAAAMGVYTVARLAARHGLHVRLHNRPDGGAFAEVEIPAALISPEHGPEDETFAALAAGAAAMDGDPADRAAVFPAQADGGEETGRAGQARPTHSPGGDRDTMVLPVVTGEGRPRDARHEDLHGGDGHGQDSEGLPDDDAAAPSGPVVVGAEELRRRLGGFQRGARRGHHDGQSAGPPAEEEMQP